MLNSVLSTGKVGITLCLVTAVLSSTAHALIPHYEHPANSSKCDTSNMRIRKEWSALTSAERIEFTGSVECLMKLPPKSPKEFAPGATSRFEDFTAAHINNTLLIHANGVFLSWHRHFLHLFEKALVDECGFQGTLPYWNWPWWADDLARSPLFDGSATSLGGDGYWNASAAAVYIGNHTFPRGKGGGCIEDGPFANITTGFRNFKGEELLKQTLAIDALNYTPHCVYRDLNNALSPNLGEDVVQELLDAPTISDFQDTMDALGTKLNSDPSKVGPHRSGHLSVGISMSDQFASPSDPTFYLHHGMIDNMWAQWQMQNPHKRTHALSGTVTTLNNPPSENATLDTVVHFGFLDKSRKLGELMNTSSRKYCYQYEYKQGAEKPY